MRQELGLSLTIEAGAGTGKTTLLVDRIIRLLAHYDLSELVAITFTEKAAGELVDRLRGSLERLSDSDSPIILSPLKRIQALGDLDKAHISTIHAFASWLIRAYAFDLSIDPDFEHLDQSGQEDLLNELISSEFSRHDPARDLELSQFLTAGGSLSKLIALCFELVDQFDVIGNLNHREEPYDIYYAVVNLANRANELFADAEANCLDLSDNGYLQIKNLSQITAERLSDRQKVGWLGEVAGVKATAGVKKNWKGSSLPDFKAGIALLKEEAKLALFTYRAHVLAMCLKRLYGIISSLQNQKRKNGLLTFHDQLFYASQLFQNPILTREISERFRSLLIDEFQDTDPLQAQIALAVSGHENRSAAANICIVGDVKQSIYRFRGADRRLFQKVSNTIASFGRRVNISQNFRSSRGIIDFVNAFFSHFWSGDGPNSYVPLQPLEQRLEPTPLPSVEFLELDDEDATAKLRAPAIRKLEASAIAEKICRAVEEGWQVLGDQDGQSSLRPITYDDIVILMPGRTGIQFYTDSMTKFGIPFKIETGKGLAGSQFARDLINVIRAVDNPADKLSVVGAARSSLLGVNDSEIALWGKLSDNSFDIFSPPAGLSDHLNEAISFLIQLSTEKFQQSPVQVLKSISAKCGVDEQFLLNRSREVDADYWQTFKLIAHSLSIDGKNLRHFRRKLDSIISGDDESGSANDSTEGNRVKIMTIHSAKGLEFPMVILANLGKPNNKNSKVLVDRDSGSIEVSLTTWDDDHLMTTNYPAAQETEKTELNDELLRLLYVGMTRAKDHLLISRLHSPKGNPYSAWIDEFMAATDGKPKAPFVRRIWVEGAYSPLERAETNDNIDVNNILLRYKELIEKRRSDAAKVQANSFQIFRPGIDSRAEQFAGQVTGSSLSSDLSVKVGRAFHEYFAKTSFSDQLNMNLLEQICSLESIEVEDVHALIISFLSSDFWKKIILHGKARREMPVSAVVENIMVRGIIDVIWEIDGAFAIADYKTGSPDHEQHKLQVDYYAKAIEKSTGKKVVSKWLVYPSGGESILWH